jgi:hypothetical protein
VSSPESATRAAPPPGSDDRIETIVEDEQPDVREIEIDVHGRGDVGARAGVVGDQRAIAVLEVDPDDSGGEVLDAVGDVVLRVHDERAQFVDERAAAPRRPGKDATSKPSAVVPLSVS